MDLAIEIVHGLVLLGVAWIAYKQEVVRRQLNETNGHLSAMSRSRPQAPEE